MDPAFFKSSPTENWRSRLSFPYPRDVHVLPVEEQFSASCLHRVVWHSTTARFSLVWSQEPITWFAEANESSPSQHTVFVLSIVIILPYSSRYLLQWYFLFNIWRVILNSVYIFCLDIYTTICTAHLITSSILLYNSLMVNNRNLNYYSLHNNNNNNSLYPTNIYYPYV